MVHLLGNIHVSLFEGLDGSGLNFQQILETESNESTCYRLPPKLLFEVLAGFYRSVFPRTPASEVEQLCYTHYLNFKYVHYPLLGQPIPFEWGAPEIPEPITLDRTKLCFELLLLDFLIHKRKSETKSVLADMIRQTMNRDVISDVREFKWEVTKTLPRLHLLKGAEPADLDQYLDSYPGVTALREGFESLPEEAIELYSNAIFFKRYVPRHFETVRADFERRLRRSKALCTATDDEVCAFLEGEIENPLSEFLFGTLETRRVNLFLVGHFCDLYRNKGLDRYL